MADEKMALLCENAVIGWRSVDCLIDFWFTAFFLALFCLWFGLLILLLLLLLIFFCRLVFFFVAGFGELAAKLDKKDDKNNDEKDNQDDSDDSPDSDGCQG